MATTGAIDLERIVEKPTWKQMLSELIITEQIDPWNIDISEIAEGFLKKVRDMKKLDLFIPANVILASAILLRYKSSYLQLYEPQPEVMAATEGGGIEMEAVPQLAISSRIPPKRQMTFSELEEAIEKAITYESVVYTPAKRGGIDEIINLALTQEDIEKSIENVMNRIKGCRDETGWALFSNLVRGSAGIEVIYTLLSILYLTQKELIEIRQDEIFGEIFIHLNKAK